MKYSLTCSRRRMIILAAVAAVSLQTGCRSVQHLPGQWLSLSAPRDGRLEDFSRRITSHLFENGMMVGLGNDKRNLYVFFTPDIRHSRRYPGRARLTLWIDGKGGKARKLGLEHVSAPAGRGMPPAGVMDKGSERSQRPPEEDDQDERERKPSPGEAEELLKVIGPEKGKEMYMAPDGSQGPAVRLASDWGDYSYQVRVPIRGSGAWPGLDARPGQAIGIGLQWEIERHRAPDKGSMNRPRRGPGGGGPGRGGMPPDMENGPRSMPGEGSVNKRKIWLKTFLADR